MSISIIINKNTLFIKSFIKRVEKHSLLKRSIIFRSILKGNWIFTEFYQIQSDLHKYFNLENTGKKAVDRILNEPQFKYMFSIQNDTFISES